jgi:hypothetical protein
MPGLFFCNTQGLIQVNPDMLLLLLPFSHMRSSISGAMKWVADQVGEPVKQAHDLQ